MPTAMRRATGCVGLALLTALAAPASASAQPIDLGTVEVALPPPLRAMDFVIVARLEPPRAGARDVPADATDALARYYAAVDLLRSAMRDARSAPEAARDAERARIAGLAERESRARDVLAAVLDRYDATLTRPALMLLGALRFETAAEAYEGALVASEACVSTGSSACPEPVIDDARAVAAWSRVDGGDVLAAYSLYLRGYSAREHGDLAGAEQALEGALAVPHLPPVLEADAAFLLADSLDATDRDAITEALSRCARLPVPELAPHCALRAAERLLDDGRAVDALAMLAPILDAPDVQEDARLFAGEAVARLETTSALTSLPPAQRARALTLGAERLAAHGLITRAVAVIDEARAIAPDPARDALSARLSAASTTAPDTPEAWLRRAVLFCASALPAIGFGRMDVRGRFTPRGVRGLRASHLVPRDLAPLAACLAERAPSPETPLTGAFRAVVTLETRVDAFVPRIRHGEPDGEP